MTHQGRIHKITGQAEEASERLLGAIPREEIVYGTGSRRPLWYGIEFRDTAEERRYLKCAAQRYNALSSPGDHLIAHGMQGSSSLCQILLDGELRHIKGIENYGDLGSYGESTQVGGYWDMGWGVFVATPKTIQDNLISSEGNDFLVVPLSDLRGILLPSPLIDVVGREFPQHGTLLKGYRQFAQELERLI